MKLGIKGHMTRLTNEVTCLIHRSEKAKTCAIKVTNEKCSNSFFITIIDCKHKIN